MIYNMYKFIDVRSQNLSGISLDPGPRNLRNLLPFDNRPGWNAEWICSVFRDDYRLNVTEV